MTPPLAQNAPWSSKGHETFGHTLGLLLQSTSHLHEFAQSIRGHADGPVQLMSQGPAPQLILPHALPAEQLMVQPMPWAQSMPPQAFVLLHLIVQS